MICPSWYRRKTVVRRIYEVLFSQLMLRPPVRCLRRLPVLGRTINIVSRPIAAILPSSSCSGQLWRRDIQMRQEPAD